MILGNSTSNHYGASDKESAWSFYHFAFYLSNPILLFYLIIFDESFHSCLFLPFLFLYPFLSCSRWFCPNLLSVCHVLPSSVLGSLMTQDFTIARSESKLWKLFGDRGKTGDFKGERRNEVVMEIDLLFSEMGYASCHWWSRSSSRTVASWGKTVVVQCWPVVEEDTAVWRLWTGVYLLCVCSWPQWQNGVY